MSPDEALDYARRYWQFGQEPKTQAALHVLAATVERVRALLFADSGHPHGKGYQISPAALRAALNEGDET